MERSPPSCGENLRAARRRRGMSQTTPARETRLERAGPVGLDQGHTPSSEGLAVRAVAHPLEADAVALVALAKRLPAHRRAELLQAEMEPYLRRGFRVLSK